MNDLSLLQKLIKIPALAGDEGMLITFLHQRAAQKGLPVTICENQGIIFGDVSVETYIMAHIDEVGARVIYAKDDHIQIEGVGWVTPSMYCGRDIEIYTSQGMVSGIIIAKPLETQVSSFLDLQIILSPGDYKKVARGNTVRLSTVWKEDEEMLFASVLDNRLGVAQLLWSLETMLQKGVDIQNVARCFSTQEETRNEGAIRILQTYMPKQMIIVDMIPYGLWDNIDMSGLHVLEKTPDYERSSSWNTLLTSCSYAPICLDSDDMNRSEAMQFEAITSGSALHVFTPMYNYHHGTYALPKKTLSACTQSITELLFAYMT